MRGTAPFYGTKVSRPTHKAKRCTIDNMASCNFMYGQLFSGWISEEMDQVANSAGAELDCQRPRITSLVENTSIEKTQRIFTIYWLLSVKALFDTRCCVNSAPDVQQLLLSSYCWSVHPLLLVAILSGRLIVVKRHVVVNVLRIVVGKRNSSLLVDIFHLIIRWS